MITSQRSCWSRSWCHRKMLQKITNNGQPSLRSTRLAPNSQVLTVVTNWTVISCYSCSSLTKLQMALLRFKHTDQPCHSKALKIHTRLRTGGIWLRRPTIHSKNWRSRDDLASNIQIKTNSKRFPKTKFRGSDPWCSLRPTPTPTRWRRWQHPSLWSIAATIKVIIRSRSTISTLQTTTSPSTKTPASTSPNNPSAWKVWLNRTKI